MSSAPAGLHETAWHSSSAEPVTGACTLTSSGAAAGWGHAPAKGVTEPLTTLRTELRNSSDAKRHSGAASFLDSTWSQRALSDRKRHRREGVSGRAVGCCGSCASTYLHVDLGSGWERKAEEVALSRVMSQALHVLVLLRYGKRISGSRPDPRSINIQQPSTRIAALCVRSACALRALFVRSTGSWLLWKASAAYLLALEEHVLAAPRFRLHAALCRNAGRAWDSRQCMFRVTCRRFSSTSPCPTIR
jgi:hypothetical protein